MDDYDIYGDLHEIEEVAKKERHEVQELERKISQLEARVSEKEQEKQAIAEKNKILTENISSLLLTAKAELQRKDNVIADYRKKCDDTVFRRGHNIVREVKRVSKCTQTNYVRLIHIGVQVEQNEDEFKAHNKKLGGAREHDRDRDRDRDRRDRDRDRDRDGDRNRNRERERDRNHDRGKDRERFREPNRSLERHRDRENASHRRQDSERDRYREQDYGGNYRNNDKRSDDRDRSSNNYSERKLGKDRQKLAHRGATSRSKSREAPTDMHFKNEQNTICHEENSHYTDRKKREKTQEKVNAEETEKYNRSYMRVATSTSNPPSNSNSLKNRGKNEPSTQNKIECRLDKDIRKLHETAENIVDSLPVSESQNISRQIEPIVQSRVDTDHDTSHRSAVSGLTESEMMLGSTLNRAFSSVPVEKETVTQSAKDSPQLCREQQKTSANPLMKHKPVETTVTNLVDCSVTDYSQQPLKCISKQSFATSNLKSNQSSGVAYDSLDGKLSDKCSTSNETPMEGVIQQEPALEREISANGELSLEKKIDDVEKAPNDSKNQLTEEANDILQSGMQTIADVPLENEARGKDGNQTGEKLEIVQLGIEECKTKKDLNCKAKKSHNDEGKTALIDEKDDEEKDTEEKRDYIIQETVEPMDLSSSKLDNKVEKLSEKDGDKIIRTVLALLYDSPDATSTKTNASETDGDKVVENVQCLQQECCVVEDSSIQSSLIDNEAKQRSDDEHVMQKSYLKEQQSQNGVIDKQDDRSNERSDVGKLSQSSNKNYGDLNAPIQTDNGDWSATVMDETNVAVHQTDANSSTNIGNELLVPENRSAQEPLNPKPTIDGSQSSVLLIEPAVAGLKTIETTNSIAEKLPEYGIEPANDNNGTESNHHQGIRTRSKSVNLEKQAGDSEKNLSIQNYFTTFTGSQDENNTRNIATPVKTTEVAAQLESKSQDIVRNEKHPKQESRNNSNVNKKQCEKSVLQGNSDASGSIRHRLRKVFCSERSQKCNSIFSAAKKRRLSLDSSPIVHKKQKTDHVSNDGSTLSSSASSKLSDTFFSSISLPIVSTLDTIHMKSESIKLAQSGDPFQATSNVPSMATITSPIKSQDSPQRSLPRPILCAFENTSRTVNDEKHMELGDGQEGRMNNSSTIEHEMEKLHFSPRHLLASSTPLIVKPQSRLHHSTSSVPAMGSAGAAPAAVPDTLNSKSWAAPLGHPTPCLSQATGEDLYIRRTVNDKAPHDHTQDKNTSAIGAFCDFNSKPTCTDHSLRKHSVNKGKTASNNINDAGVPTYESGTVNKHSSRNRPAHSHKSQKSTNKADKNTVSSSEVLTTPVTAKSKTRCTSQTHKDKLVLTNNPSPRSKASSPQAKDSNTPVTSRKRTRVSTSPKRRKIDEIATSPTKLLPEPVAQKAIIETPLKLVDENSSEDTTMKMKEPSTVIPTSSALLLDNSCTSTTTTNALKTFETQQQSVATVGTPLVLQCEATPGPDATSTSSEVVSPSSASTTRSLCNFSLNLSLASGSTVDTDSSVVHKTESSKRFVRDVRIVRENPKLMRVYINRPGH